MMTKNLGGIIFVSNKHFETVNGMSNRFWGWGREDDEFRLQLEKFGVKTFRNKNINTGSDAFLGTHSARRKRDRKRCKGQNKKMMEPRDADDGLNTTSYRIIEQYDVAINGVSVTVLNVEVHCNKNVSPWCEC